MKQLSEWHTKEMFKVKEKLWWIFVGKAGGKVTVMFDGENPLNANPRLEKFQQMGKIYIVNNLLFRLNLCLNVYYLLHVSLPQLRSFFCSQIASSKHLRSYMALYLVHFPHAS